MNENDYVEMVCILERYQIQIEPLPEGLTLRHLGSTDEEELYACYHAAFQAGDAAFFFQQNEIERREFFDTLEIEQARSTPGSSGISRGDELVGFTLVIPYGKENCQISCMCVQPAEQHRGLGKVMLDHAIRESAAHGVRTITLGTDRSMKSYSLDQNFGFEEIG